MQRRSATRSVLATVLLSFVAVAGCGPGVESPRAETSPTTTNPCPTPDACGVSFEQLHRDNVRYADRLPFAGNRVMAEDFAARVRAALAPLAGAEQQPTEEAVQRAIVAVLPPSTFVQVSTKARRLPGTAFGAGVADGCIFGNISGGVLTVNVGGYIHDGGCLAVIAH
jgi:hypothetical protein